MGRSTAALDWLTCPRHDGGADGRTYLKSAALQLSGFRRVVSTSFQHLPARSLQLGHQFTAFPLKFVAVQTRHRTYPRPKDLNMNERRVLGRPKIVLNVALWVPSRLRSYPNNDPYMVLSA